jgi:hypothetical protein
MRMYSFILRILMPALSFSVCSCSAEIAIEQVLGASTASPVFLSCRAVSATEIAFEFSAPVKVLSLYFEPAIEVDSVDEGTNVSVNLKQSLDAGEKLLADILVEDENKNTLNVLVPFRGRNDRMPPLLINELRTEYSSTYKKVEFVELKILDSGNLGALRLFIATYSMKEPIFEFPSTEVRKSEYIVVHLRSIEDGLVNETGTNLGASAGTDALADARDFWYQDTSAQLGKTDAVFLLDQDNRVVDGVLLSATADKWSQTVVEDAAKFLAQQGAWLPKNDKAGIPGPADAFITANTTYSRTICRDENAADTNNAADWYITTASKATPGKKNSTERYIK